MPLVKSMSLEDLLSETRKYPLLLVAMELDGPEAGAPLAELVHPVVQCGLGHNHQMRPLDAPEL